MTFGKPNFNNNYKWELLRFCSKINTCVIGGASRLLKSFTNQYKGDIISYSDNMISDGNVYCKLGFTMSHHVPPTYYYYRSGIKQLMHRSFAKRKNLPNIVQNFDPSKTEKQNMMDDGWLRYYDAGKIAWFLKNKE